MSEQHEHRPFLLLTLALLTTVTAVVSSLGAPLVPAIAADLDVPLDDAQWTLTAALLAGAVCTPVVGRFASGRLRRPTILGGLAVVTVGTTLSALPLGLTGLVAGRALQGVGMALTPLAIAVARDVVPPARLPGTVALLSVTTVAGAGLGYPVTALVADQWGLSAAYWFGTGLLVVTLALAAAQVPPAPESTVATVDWPGVLLVASGLVALLLAVSRGETWGWTAPPTLALAVAARCCSWPGCGGRCAARTRWSTCGSPYDPGWPDPTWSRPWPASGCTACSPW